MPTDLALVDTNVLVNSLFERSENFIASRALLDRAKANVAALGLLPQNLAA